MAARELPQRQARTAALQRRLWSGLKARIPLIKLNGPEAGRIGTNLNFSTEFIEGEGLLLLCDMHGIAVASGPACLSRALKISHVLEAIGLDCSLARSNVIMSLGRENTQDEIDYVIDLFVKIVDKLRGMSPLWDEFKRGEIESAIESSPRGSASGGAGSARFSAPR